MGLWDRITGWWGKDADERLEEGAVSGQADRDAAGEDYESLKDDRSIGGSYIGGGAPADFERDSERPGSF